ncbi:hypothetical protein [Metabacillus schmidteae]|uniref:hypothetical protein n=1 Tax=Metabacillus schmidteae TaxID=2730405 RepID=UPI00158E5C9F|nr:hypothetical protein [Metabacillus schmidteae]
MNGIKCLTTFTVFQDYKEITVKNLSDEELGVDRLYLQPEYVFQIKAINDPLKPCLTFNPLKDAPFLYLEIAKINSDDTLMKFVQIYGLPLEHQEIPFNKEVKATIMDTIPFFKKLSYYKDLLYLWFELQNKQNKEGKFPFEPSTHYNSILSSNRGKSVGTVITNVLNEMKTWQESYEQIENDNTIFHCVRFKNLLETAYFQLTKAILNKATLRRCNECNELFEVTHESQKFCPPKMGRKRSTCENTHKVRKSRQKLKQSQK